MSNHICGLIALSVAAGFAIYAIFGRLFGLHRPVSWAGGGHTTCVGELASAGFIASIGTGFLQDGPLAALAVIVALPCWIVIAVSQDRANKRFQREEDALRATNANMHPGVFDVDPPDNFDPKETALLDLYDCGSCAYLGRLDASVISKFIAATSDMPDQGPNDLFVIQETLEPPIMDDADELKAFLRDHLDSRGYAILRWIPVQNL